MLFGLVTEVHAASVNQRLTIERSFTFFKDTLLNHSVHRYAEVAQGGSVSSLAVAACGPGCLMQRQWLLCCFLVAAAGELQQPMICSLGVARQLATSQH